VGRRHAIAATAMAATTVESGNKEMGGGGRGRCCGHCCFRNAVTTATAAEGWEERGGPGWRLQRCGHRCCRDTATAVTTTESGGASVFYDALKATLNSKPVCMNAFGRTIIMKGQAC
jgi:hypothetical protein